MSHAAERAQRGRLRITVWTAQLLLLQLQYYIRGGTIGNLCFYEKAINYPFHMNIYANICNMVRARQIQV